MCGLCHRLVTLVVCRTFYRVTEVAFDRCVHGFRSNTLTETEKKCIQVTSAKILRFSDRMNTRFSEVQVQMSEKAAVGAGKA